MPVNNEYITEGWYKAKEIHNLADRSALKAFFNVDALVSNECPLHPGTTGIDLFVATTHSNKSHLCFSLKQVSYIRYWLHAHGLTSSPLPLPSVNYLLTLDDLCNPPSPATYTIATELKRAANQVKKQSKRINPSICDSSLLGLRTEFERVRTVWNERRGVWMAVDFEGWEWEHALITEFGWSIVRWVIEHESNEGGDEPEEFGLKEIQEEGHWTVEEYASYRNGRFVKDNRNRYDFGETKALSKAEFKQRIGDMISKYAAEGPLYLVFHDRYGDVKYLQQLEVPGIGNLSPIPKIAPGPGIYWVDTTDMFSALEGDHKERRGLERVCALLKICGFEHPHNAGNDAHFTMAALREMASGKPLDVQREERWPNQTQTFFGQQKGLKVEWTERDFESDDDYLPRVYA